ncbi:MAG: hypothetical protein NDI69_12425 [Bacteriovoracaceae bacterium]|nr:hypothetical protein [Bacteriovoracaceae bacterium]
MKKTILLLLTLLAVPSLVVGQSLDASFETPTNMTDKQMDAAKNFEHGGIKDRVIKEGCAKVDDCKSEEEGFPLEMMIGKAYALMGMMTGGGGMIPKFTKKPAPEGSNLPGKDEAAKGAEKGADADKAAKDEDQTDYCMMVAMAYETVGGFIQDGLQKKAQEKTAKVNDVQLQSLVNLKETHKARKTTATWQSGIYGSVAACYGAMAFTGKIALDWKYWAKLGGATTLMALYIKKAKKHDDAAKKVQLVMDSIPKAGECNPWTKTSCFCSEATSKERYPAEYQEVCVLNKGNFETPKVAIGCGAVSNNKIQYDKECKCKETNTCLKGNLKTYNPKFAMANNFMNQANKGFDLLNSGEFDEGKVAALTSAAGAMAKKVKGKLDTKSIPKPNLTVEQAKMADALKEYVPGELANVAAASNSAYKGGIKEPSLSSAAISKLPDSMKNKLADTIRVNYKKGGGSDSSASSDEPDFSFPIPGQAEAESGGTEVISFAEQAISKADVSNAPETPIFDIISNRYRRSGWGKLESTTEKK